MLTNVLSNAVEHTPQGGEITFEVEEHGNELSFLITDTGKGFSDESLKPRFLTASQYGICIVTFAPPTTAEFSKMIFEAVSLERNGEGQSGNG